MVGREEISFYAIGESVHIGLNGDGFVGKILGVAIYEEGVKYKVVWWNGRERTVEWLNDVEVSPSADTEVRTIGFKAET